MKVQKTRIKKKFYERYAKIVKTVNGTRCPMGYKRRGRSCRPILAIVTALLKKYRADFERAYRTAGTSAGKRNLAIFKTTALRLKSWLRKLTSCAKMRRCCRRMPNGKWKCKGRSWRLRPRDSGAVNYVADEAVAASGSVSFDLAQFSTSFGSPW